MQSRSQRIQKKVFAKIFFCMRLLSYSILHYILHFSVHKIYFYDLRISPRGHILLQSLRAGQNL